MKNKVNVEILVPSIGKRFDVFIPVNKTVGEVIAILNKTINEITGCFPANNSLSLFNISESKVYDFNTEIIKTNIRNGSVLALF